MKLNELFDIEICKNPISRDYAMDNPGNVPYITTTSENNGIECYVDFPPQYNGGVITVSKDGGNGDAFLQQLPFCGNEKVMVLTPKQKLSDIQLFYYVTVIKFNKSLFGYGRKCSVARLSKLYIPAPEEIPMFVYDLKNQSITTKNHSNSIPELKVEKWKNFMVGKILNCDSTTLSIKDDLDEGNTPFISRSAINNGCDGYVNIESYQITRGNCLTIGAEGIYSFYQPTDFATGNKVYQLRNEHLNKYIALFLSTVLNIEDYRYSYGRARILSKLKEEIIKLPIQRNPDGSPIIDSDYKYSDEGYVPDWKFMENYIKSLPYGDRI